MLAKNLARSIRRGHPWIFRDALRTPPALADGALVTVTAPDGQPLARGFWDARSAIAVRVLEAAGGPREARRLDGGARSSRRASPRRSTDGWRSSTGARPTRSG